MEQIQLQVRRHWNAAALARLTLGATDRYLTTAHVNTAVIIATTIKAIANSRRSKFSGARRANAIPAIPTHAKSGKPANRLQSTLK